LKRSALLECMEVKEWLEGNIIIERCSIVGRLRSMLLFAFAFLGLNALIIGGVVAFFI
jgi:hypothetical protein